MVSRKPNDGSFSDRAGYRDRCGAEPSLPIRLNWKPACTSWNPAAREYTVARMEEMKQRITVLESNMKDNKDRIDRILTELLKDQQRKP